MGHVRALLKKNFKSLRHYNYRLYWISQLISVTGTWMQNVALAWLVVTMTGSAVALGTATALQFLPILLLSLFAGVFIDRWPKLNIILTTQSASALQAFMLWILVATKAVTLWEIYALSLFIGLVNAFDQPGRQAFVAEMVPDEDVGNAIALNSLLFNAARTVGPAIAGITIAELGVAPSFLLNAASYLAIIAALLMMRRKELRTFTSKVHSTVREGIKEGISFAVKEPSIASILIVLIFVGTFGYNFNTVLPLLVRFVMRGGPEVFGVLTAALGIGSMIGALFVAGRQKPTRRFIYLFEIIRSKSLSGNGSSSAYPSMIFAFSSPRALIFSSIISTPDASGSIPYTSEPLPRRIASSMRGKPSPEPMSSALILSL